MNPRVLVIAGIVLILLVVGGVVAFFTVIKKEQPPEKTPQQIAMETDTDNDTYSDFEEQQAGTNPSDPTRFPGSHKVVLRARRDISSNTLLKADDFRDEEVPSQGGAPSTAIRTDEKNRVVGKVSQVDIHADEFIVEGMVYAGTPQLSYLVPKYKRAISIRYDELAAVTGLIQLGDLVDVIGFYTIRRREGGDLEYAKTNVQSARIVAKGQAILPRDPADTSPVPIPTSLTLAVYPHEAEELVWMENYQGGGELTLALRAPVNDVYARTSGVHENSMFGRQLMNDPDRIEIFAGARGAAVARFDPTTRDRIDLNVDNR